MIVLVNLHRYLASTPPVLLTSTSNVMAALLRNAQRDDSVRQSAFPARQIGGQPPSPSASTLAPP